MLGLVKIEFDGNKMKTLDIGNWYTRQDIHEICGGEIQSYLPQVSGKIVCGCFTKDFNPDAPAEIQVGNLPKVVKKAKIFAQQNTAVPVFMKDKSLLGKTKKIWEYYGLYVCEQLLDDKESLQAAEQKSQRFNELALILRLKAAPSPPNT